ncbi:MULTISPECIES: hypothetical protein [unclassified Mesorhizobium]|uniref:hypothetical protein n=1 Tax=unclassified Mesorhizobium TaxID=325217 RepID=UPI000FD1B7AC|nr:MULTISPECIES: hypothetical protein [unclassified Mesorhizobium]RUV96208.1 hypothetical protein EOA88_02995 [Mesorhizobium sp. M5C.F.Ca.IN.020.14.1.1]RUV28437.1 hypothetical protein EOA86_19830 [Mesorhizobium sp. M5C.F.Ca.IN.020.32.2.1]RWG45984.1 MAG: hypothetical protein EOQ62_16015 [Mesorhizobium sp.]RWH49779.1 MAG: hypothetical protein EOQ80_05970 [Mesorhizobium sp.]RWH55456.1 MAG: hypothetical protein EOQ82_16395 [Mesorhizobium sp.]
MAHEDDIQMVKRHVRLGRKHVSEQQDRIAELDRLELPSETARDFLELLEQMQELHKKHLSRLLAKTSPKNAA